MLPPQVRLTLGYLTSGTVNLRGIVKGYKQINIIFLRRDSSPDGSLIAQGESSSPNPSISLSSESSGSSFGFRLKKSDFDSKFEKPQKIHYLMKYSPRFSKTQITNNSLNTFVVWNTFSQSIKSSNRIAS